MTLLRLYVRAIDCLSTIVGYAMAALMPVMVCVILFEVIARYAFASPTIWAYDTAIFIFGYIGLLSGAYALRRGSHIRVDIFHAQLSPRGKAAIDLLTAPIIAFFLILIIIYAGDYAMDGIRSGARRSTEWGPPMGHFLLVIPIGALLVLLQATALWVRDAYLLIAGKPLER